MRTGHKRYFVVYESDRCVCRSYDHTYGNASTIKTAKNYIRKIRTNMANDNPRNFRIFDSWADVEGSTGFVPCVYKEA